MTAEKERWEKVEENLGRMELINRSPFVPHNFNEWLEHRKGCAMDRKRREERKLEEKQAASRRDPRLPPPGPRVKIVPFAMGGKVFNDGRSMVLAMPTIWNHWYTPTEEHPQALWPCAEEMKWEGDERKTSKFRRFPALPRYPGNETVAFKHRYILPMLPFDEVWKLPTAESVAAATETTPAEEMQEMEELLGKGLLDAIDCITHDNY